MVRSLNLSKRALLGVGLALALGALSLANWLERGRFGVPEDGVMWSDSEAGVSASRVGIQSPAALVGVRPGDILLSIGGRPVDEALDATRILVELGAWTRAEYVIERDGRSERLSVVIGESASRGALAGFLLVLGWSCASLGLLVWLRGARNAATHRFYAFSLTALATFSLSATGQLDVLDRIVYWVDVWALLLMPALFLDFCTRFAGGRNSRHVLVRASYAMAVGVGAAHHAAAGSWLGSGIGEPTLVQFFDTAPLVLLVAGFAAAALVIRQASRRAQDPALRRQLHWLGYGATAAIAPFAGFYVIPFLVGAAPGPNQAFSVLSLVLLPASITVALFRYRLMDVEILWRRAAASAAAAALLLVAAYVALFRSPVGPDALDRFGPLIWLASLALAALLYRPIRNWAARALERRAYKDRYEDRRTLAAFAAELATETDLARMVSAVGVRLARTFDVDRVAVLAPLGPDGESRDSYRPLYVHPPVGIDAEASLELAAIPSLGSSVGSCVVLADPTAGDLPAAVRKLQCVHFVPCRLRGRTLAWVGLGLTRFGNLLSSDDLSLAETLAGPFAIALENARLYKSLERKAAQYQLLKDYNENIVESLSVGILVLDSAGRVQSWNTHLELTLRISRDQAIGRSLRALLPAALVESFETCLDDSGTGHVHKFRLRAAEFPDEFRPESAEDIGERMVNLAVAPLVARDFKRIGCLVILDDVTDRIELEERVVQAEKLSSVGLLAAGVAHEVNTPLAVISSYSQMLAEQFAQGSAEAAMLGKMTEQTFRASEIVNSLLDFSRTSGVTPVACDIDEVLQSTLELIEPQLRDASVTVEADLPGGVPVMGSKGKLQQVFLNLFLNARDAMPSGGTLTVACEALAGTDGMPSVEVLVADTGRGMEPAVQRRIFDPFYTTKGPGMGTGLGLAVTYGIVREHSGAITVDSAPGAGTTFKLTFPLAKQPVNA